MPNKGVYRLTEGDREIFKRIKDDPAFFTDYYLRGEMTGTWWRPVTDKSTVPEIQEVIEKWQRGYEILLKKWNKLNRPNHFDHGDREYKVLFDLDYDRPNFHDHHGFIFLPWQKQLWNAKQTTKVVIGGYGAAKSWGVMVSNLIYMATLKYYRCFVIAPYSIQATEIYEQVKLLVMDTEYYNRFLYRGPNDSGFTSKPFPQIRVKNDLVGESTMNFFSLDKPEKILNLSGDSFHVEQSEQVNNIDALLEIIGSRLRGQVAGRERQGIITFVANSDEAGNPELWDIFDEAQTDPDGVFSIQPETFWNTFITPRQLKDIEKRMPKDPEAKARALKGERATGNGLHFSKDSINKCKSKTLDDLMQYGRDNHLPGYVYETQPKAQVVEWALPPKPDRMYFLAADPGWSNPPHRDSAAMMVFDVTDFPTIPAHLQAFSWVYGNNSPDPWISKYLELADRYSCLNRNAFDGTGLQGSGYDHKLHGLDNLNPWPVKLGGSMKFIYMNAAKTLVSRGLLQFPKLPMLFSQLSNYRMPDDNLRQDLVMTVVIAAAWLDSTFYGALDQSETKERIDKNNERFSYHSREGVHAR